MLVLVDIYSVLRIKHSSRRNLCLRQGKGNNMVSQKKKTQVESLTSQLEKHNNFLVIKAERTRHQSLEKLRRELRKTGAQVKVIKNAHFEKAVNKLAPKNKIYQNLKKTYFPMKDPSAMVFLGQVWDTGLKSFWNFAQEDKTLSFKLSLLDNNIYNQSDTEKIAKLPGRTELIGKIVGSMKSPMSKFVYAAKFNTNKLVYILRAKSKN